MKKLIPLLITLLIFTTCTKKLVTDESDNLVKPKFKDNKKLQVAELIIDGNLSGLKEIKGVLTQFIKDDLIELKTIQNSLEQSETSNEDKLLESYFLYQKSENEKSTIAYNDMFSSSSSTFSIASNDNEESDSNVLDQFNQKIDYEKNKRKYLLKYYDIYNEKRIDFKPYFGIDINSPVNQEVQIKKLTVLDNILKMETEKVFQLSQIYSQLDKNPADYVLLGKIKSEGNSIVLLLKLYDKYLRSFIWDGKFSFNSDNLSLNIKDNTTRVTKKIKEQFSDYPRGTLVVKTEPQGAYVFFNGKNLGKSELTTKVPVGYHEIEILKQDYSKKKKKIFISQNKKHLINLTLDKSDKKGTIAVQSEPQGADVYLDLDYKGKTPLVLEDLPVGRYKVRLEKEGYKHSYSNVKIKENNKQLLSFAMNKGKTVYTPVEDLSEEYNTAKNIFLYSSFISLTAMIYAYLETEKYSDRYVGEIENGTSSTSARVQDAYRKYQNAKEMRDITVGTSIGLIALTAIFQMLELHTEDIEVGFSPKEEKEKAGEKDIGTNFKVKYKF